MGRTKPQLFELNLPPGPRLSTLARQIRSVSSTAGSTVTVRSLEPGMDIFKRQDDGTWKIIRYLAYTSPE
jgi:hypothetical protein